jgi:cytochrome oxidase assembly protein ShyY1
MKFRPSLVPSIIVAAALIVLVNLGLWQLRRNDQTNARLAEVEAVHEGPPATAAELTGDPEKLKWRKADVTGRFLGKPQFVTGRTEFGSPGFDLLQSCQVDSGPVILVNRGWIPMEGWQDALATVPPGDVDQPVRGLILPIDGPPDLPPIPADTDVPERWADGDRADFTGCQQQSHSPYAAIARRNGDIAFPIVVVMGESLGRHAEKQPSPLPVTGYIARPAVRPHLEYAATWFMIGGVLILMWIYGGFIRGREREPS